MPNKGTVDEVVSGKFNRKTKGSYLIQLCLIVVGLQHIWSMSIIPNFVVPAMLMKAHIVIEFQKRCHIPNSNPIEYDWIETYVECVSSLSLIDNTDLIYMYREDYL